MGEQRDFIRSFCETEFPDSGLSYESVSFDDPFPGFHFEITIADSIPSDGVRSYFLGNLCELGFDLIVVMGTRNSVDLVLPVSTIGAYLAQGRRISEETVIEGALEDEHANGFTHCKHVVLVPTFPWERLEECASEVGLASLFALPIDDDELNLLQKHGFLEFEKHAELDRSDVFSI